MRSALQHLGWSVCHDDRAPFRSVPPSTRDQAIGTTAMLYWNHGDALDPGFFRASRLAAEAVSNTEIAERIASRPNGHCLPLVRPPWTGRVGRPAPTGTAADHAPSPPAEILSVTLNPPSSPGRHALVALASAAIPSPVARASTASSPGAPRRSSSPPTHSRGEGPRRRRALPPPARTGGRAVRHVEQHNRDRPANALLTGVSLGCWASGTAGV